MRPLLPGYALASADSWAVALRHARRTAYDLYIVCSPLGWAVPAEICRRLRSFDPYTPIILFSHAPMAGERRAALLGGSIDAFVGRSDAAHNLAATAAQLVMLAELRSTDAVRRGLGAVDDHVAQRLARLHRRLPHAEPKARTQMRIKGEACRIFGEAGGSRAGFEELWPAIYESALKRVREAGA